MKQLQLQIGDTSPESQNWSLTIGRFFQAFAIIELITTEFINRMAGPFKYKSMKKKFLSQKLTWIIENLSDHTKANREARLAIIDALEEIRDLSHFRNILAHASVGLKPYPNSNETEMPTLAGILNFKPDEDEQDFEFISLEDIKEKSEESETLAKKFLDCLNEMVLTREDSQTK